MTTAQQRDLSTAEVQQAAQKSVRDYIAIHKREPTGEMIGKQFGMGERWGRNQIAAVREQGAGTAPARRHGTSGTARPTVADAVAARESVPPPARATFGPGPTAQPSGAAAARPAAQPAAPPVRTGTSTGTGAARAADPAGAEAARGSGTTERLGTLLAGTARQVAAGDNPVSIWVRAITVISVSVVAVVAAVVSYVHMHELAEHSGEGWRSILIPLSVDGLLVAASMVMLVRRQANEKVGLLPWLGVALGLAASLGANVLSVGELSWVNLVRIIVSAWPPVALALSVEFLLIVTGGRRRKDDGT
jgi:hypothetical protein